MKALHAVGVGIKKKEKEIEIDSFSSLKEHLSDKEIVSITAKGDEGYQFFKRSAEIIGCDLFKGTKTFPQNDNLVKKIFDNLLKIE